MRTNFDGKHDRIDFDSFTEALQYADTNKYTSTSATQQASRGYYSNGWSGFNTFEDAIKAGKAGYPEGKKHIDAFKAILDTRLESAHEARQQVYNDVCGTGGWDMGLVMTGQPECALEWEDTHIMEKRQKGSGRIIKLVVNCTASCNVATKVIELRGACVGAIIDCLENDGYSVELESVITCDHNDYRGNSGTFDIRVPLKKAGEPLQLDQLAFALVSPSWLRRIGFVHIANCGKIGKAASENYYGTPRDIKPEQLTEEQVDLYFPRAHGSEPQWNSTEAALQWITEQLSIFGINLKKAEK